MPITKTLSWTIDLVGLVTGKVTLVNPKVTIYIPGNTTATISNKPLTEFPSNSKIYTVDVSLDPNTYLALYSDDNGQTGDELFELRLDESDNTSVLTAINVVNDNVTNGNNQILTTIATLDGKSDLVTSDLKRLLGLNNENHVEDLFINDINGALVKSRIRLFTSRETAQAATKDSVGIEGAIAAYEVTAVYENKVPKFYRSTRIA